MNMTTETEHPRVRFSSCWSDKLGAEIKARSLEPYAIEMHGTSSDFMAFEKAVEQGIDSHLEAVFFRQGKGTYGRARFEIEPGSLPVLVRRLMESGDENAESLAVSICETLNIELV